MGKKGDGEGKRKRQGREKSAMEKREERIIFNVNNIIALLVIIADT